MRKFVKRYINSHSGLADHIEVATAPQAHDHVNPTVDNTIPVIVDGVELPPLEYMVEELEIEEQDGVVIRAREYLALMNKSQAEQDADGRWMETKPRKPLRPIEPESQGKQPV